MWQRPEGDDTYQVPVAEVEQTIREACRRWHVVESIADPFRWTRTLQALESERLPVVEFPHSSSRLTAATTDLYSAAVNGRMRHSGNAVLAAHVAAAVIVEDPQRHKGCNCTAKVILAEHIQSTQYTRRLGRNAS